MQKWFRGWSSLLPHVVDSQHESSAAPDSRWTLVLTNSVAETKNSTEYFLEPSISYVQRVIPSSEIFIP